MRIARHPSNPLGSFDALHLIGGVPDAFAERMLDGAKADELRTAILGYIADFRGEITGQRGDDIAFEKFAAVDIF